MNTPPRGEEGSRTFESKMSPFVDDDEDVCCSPESSSRLLSSSSSSTFGINKEVRRPTKPDFLCLSGLFVCSFCSFLVVLPKKERERCCDGCQLYNYATLFVPVYKNKYLSSQKKQWASDHHLNRTRRNTTWPC